MPIPKNPTRYGGDGVAAKDFFAMYDGSERSLVSVLEEFRNALSYSIDAINGGAKSSIDLSAGDVTLTFDELKCKNAFEIATGHTSNCLILNMSAGKIVYISNGSTGNCLVKNKLTDTAITVAAGKAAVLRIDSDGVIRRVTADSALT